MRATLQSKPEEGKADRAAPFAGRPSGAKSGLPIFLQAKLAVNQPGDAFEQEADRVASATTGQSQACPTCGGSGDSHSCPACQAAAQAPEDKIQLKRVPGAGGAVSAGGVNTTGGSALSANVRERIEPVLGYDLGHVRVHHDPASREAATALRARAFTHGNDIWLGRRESPEDVELMAHEATHVVQQGAGKAPAELIQRLETTDDGEAPKARLFGRIEEETGVQVAPAKPKNPAPQNSGADVAGPAAPAPKPAKPLLTKEQQEARSKIDPGEKQQKRGEAEGDAHPDIDHPGIAKPKAEAGALETKQRVDEPPKPITVEAEPKGKKDKEKSQKGASAAPVLPGDMAFAAADSVSAPDANPPVSAPAPVFPVDSANQPLPPNPAADLRMSSLAGEAQVLRDEGLRLRQSAAEMRSNAYALRGNLQMVSSGVGNSEAVTSAFHEHSKARHDAIGQADTGLGISEQKAATVAEQAPGGVARAGEEKAKSSEVSGEAGSLAGESASQSGDDEEADAKAQENSGKMNQVSGDIGTIDNAVGQAQSAAETLVQDAAHAKTTNTATRTKLADTNATLAQTDSQLEAMDGQNAAARGQLASLASGPDELLAQAQALDDQGQQLIDLSKDIETRLAASQAGYAQAMKGIPKEEEEAPVPDAAVQREPEEAEVPEPAEPEAKQIDLNEALPDWLTGEQKPSDEERQRAYQENEERRLAEIREIEGANDGGFDKLSQGDKALMALRLTGRNLFGGVSKISWPGWGKVGEGAGKLIIGLFDPRSALTGALSGVNMILNASVQFFKQPSWGGLLKLAADIATGITIILGSIVALAGVIAAIMTAISILSFGTLAPICGPVIAFCATVMSTVGGWTFWAGMVALGLQALVFLKDLYAASTAKTADELQKSSEAMSADAKNAGNAALQAGMGKLAQFGGRAMQAEISAAGGGTNFARGVASKSLLGEAGEGFRKTGVKGFGKALGKGVGRRAVSAGKGIKQAVTHPIQSIKDLRAAMKEAPKQEPMSFKQGISKDFLVGSSKEATVVSQEAKIATAAVDEGKLVQSTRKPGPDLSPDELSNELKSAEKAPKQKISEGNFKEKSELPNDHEVVSSGAVDCRRSVKPICLLKSRAGATVSQAEVDNLVAKIAKQTGQAPEDVERFLRLSNQMSGRQQSLASSLLEKAESGNLSAITAEEAQDLDKMLERLDKPRGIDKPVGSRKRKLDEDPFSGDPLKPGSPEHKDQRWFEFRQREVSRGKPWIGEGDPGYNEAYQQWLGKYERPQAAGKLGNEQELAALKRHDIPQGKKLRFENPDPKIEGFEPEATIEPGSRDVSGSGKGGTLVKKAKWGEPYHFVEVKDWASMSQTGNVKLMLDYVELHPGSTLELIVRDPLGSRPFGISGPLLERLGALEDKGIVKMRYLPEFQK
jgi:hypothetical protein